MNCAIAGCTNPRERRGLCQKHHWRLVHHGSPLYEPEEKLCTHAGCTGKHKAHGLCVFHYIRKKHGLPLDGPIRTISPKRYVQITRPAHPLAFKNGRVTVHRMVLFDRVQGSRLPCFWCGAPLEWKANLFVDHLDHDRHNNEHSNLVPSCNSCNAGRMLNSKPRQSIYS